MELRRLRLTDFRGVRKADVGFRAPGVTVVLADNEAGKSSLLEALGMLFRLPDDSRHRDLRSVQPVGRDVATTVEADLVIGGHDLTYRKTWFRGRGTELQVDGRGYTGREAHDRAADLFARHVDQQLWESLVVGQAASLVQPVPREIGALLGVLRRQADESGDEAEAPGEGGVLVEAVETEYRKYFTGRDGRPTGALAAAMADRDGAAAELAEARQRLQRIQQVIVEAERLHNERLLVADQQAEHQRGLERLAARLDSARLAESALAKADAAAQLARVRADAARSAASTRAQLITDQAQARRDADEAETALAAAQAAVEQAERAAQSARSEVTEWAGRLRERRERLSHWSRARRRRQDADDLNRLQARVDAVASARADEAAARAVLTRIGDVGADDLDRVDKLIQDLALAQATAAAAAPSLAVRRLGRTAVQLDGATSASVRRDEVVEVPVTDVTTVHVAGVLDVTVRPGSDTASARAAVEQARADLDEALDTLGVPDVATLRSLVRDREDATRAAADAVRLAEVHLAGDTFDAIVAARDQIAARLSAADGDETPEPDGSPAPDEAALEAAVREAEAAHEEARSAQERAQGLLAQKRTDQVEARVRAQNVTDRHAQLTEQLDAGRVEQPDDAVLDRADAAVAAADAAEAAAHQARQEFVDAGLDTVAAQHAEAREVADQLAGQLAEIDAGRHAARARLDDAGAAGLATEVDVAEAKSAQADEHCRLVSERAEAARLLRDTLAEHRLEARRAYAAPLKALIEQLGRIAFGPTFDVTLDDLEVTERHLDGLVLPVESLSTGAREQLAIVVRLAISRLTAPDDGGVPLILDDALGWADPRRLAQMLRLLGEAGRSGQVVLLTSQRARYNLVPGAGEPVRLQPAG